MDVVCLHPFDFADSIVFGKEDDRFFNTACMKFPASNTMTAAMADSCANPDRFMPWDTPKRL